jgi:menaquinone-9 beta-reductase
MFEPNTPGSPRSARSFDCDVIVIGGGLAGKAASLHLAKAGLKVTCVEPEQATRPTVGESLDWSAPDLLKTLGLPMEHLIENQIATWKRHVTVKQRDGCSESYIPSAWLAGPPFHIEPRTLHVDRQRLDDELMRMTLEHGISVVREGVVSIERKGEKIISVQTTDGTRLSAPWFVDASGSGASLLGREFKLPTIYYGPTKVALWTYFKISQPIEGTTLYMDPAPSQYLDWVWEIPINPGTVSVGFVTTGAAIKAKREQGFSVDEIFREQLKKFPRFESLQAEGALGPCNVTSFRCRVYAGVAGPNWLIAGEAASMVDPITANGVTAALRQAAEASSLILKYFRRGELPARARRAYNARVLHLAKFFNGGIEKIVYEPTVRNRIGLLRAGMSYTSPAWSMNAVYARLKPVGLFSTYLFAGFLAIFRASAFLLHQVCMRLGARGTANATSM